MLHRCPCCHAPARVYHDDFLQNFPFYVACTDCGYSGMFDRTREGAICLWNEECMK